MLNDALPRAIRSRLVNEDEVSIATCDKRSSEGKYLMLIEQYKKKTIMDTESFTDKLKSGENWGIVKLQL